MRESIGGAMIFWIVLFLFSIFIAFIAFIIKYARVYKIKNSVINYIDKNGGIVKHSDIDGVLNNMTYQQSGEYKICRYFPSDEGVFYYIELYSNTEFPLVGKWLHYVISIKGETRQFDLNEEILTLNDSDGTDNDNTWFYGDKDQCYLCVLGDRCSAIGLE